VGLVLLLLPCLGFEWPGRVDRIRHALERAEPRERKELVRELGHYSAATVENALLFALEDGDLEVRLEAADAAGRVRLRAGVPILMDWLDDKEAAARRAAVTALGRIREPRAHDALVRALGDAAADVRRAAVGALEQLGGPGGTDVVVPIAGRLSDLDLSVRVAAIDALANLRDGRALVPLLGAALDASAELRALALSALGAIGDAQAVPALTRALGDEVDDVRLAAAAALGRLGDPGAVRPLRAALSGVETRVTQAVLTALGNIDDDAARAALIEQLGNPGLRGAASDALQLQAARLARAGDARKAASESLVLGLAAALDAGGDAETRLAAANALAEVARVLPIDGALDRVLGALANADAPLAAALLRALGRSGSAPALMVLVERLAQSEGEALRAVLDALQAHFERAEPDGRAADPLLEALPRAVPAERLRIVELLGKVRATRAVATLAPLLEHADADLRTATAQTLGAIGDSAAAPGLLQALEHPSAATRFAAAQALGKVADAPTVRALLERVISPSPGDAHALLIPLGPALARLAAQRALSAALEKSARDVLTALIRGEDDELAVRALDATGQWVPRKALSMLAHGLRSRASRRRAAATAAAVRLPAAEVRPIARYVIGQGSTREVTAALATLGEVGDHRDMKAILKVARREHWPVPGAAAYTLYRLARRGMLRAFADKPDLCALGASREPYLRANIAATMAALALDGCGEKGPDPLRWLSGAQAPAVRLAAARWTQAARAAGRIDAAQATRALERCASTDIEESVRAACEDPGPIGKDAFTPIESYLYASDGVSLLRDGLFALRFADGAVLLGYADPNGHVRVPAAAHGEVRLEDPSQVQLEPAD
jgi:cellulose synthase operon protein C